MVPLIVIPSMGVFLIVMIGVVWLAWRTPDPDWMKRSFIGKKFHGDPDEKTDEDADNPDFIDYSDEESWVQTFLKEKDMKERNTVRADKEETISDSTLFEPRKINLATGWYPTFANKEKYWDGEKWGEEEREISEEDKTLKNLKDDRLTPEEIEKFKNELL